MILLTLKQQLIFNTNNIHYKCVQNNKSLCNKIHIIMYWREGLLIKNILGIYY